MAVLSRASSTPTMSAKPKDNQLFGEREPEPQFKKAGSDLKPKDTGIFDQYTPPHVKRAGSELKPADSALFGDRGADKQKNLGNSAGKNISDTTISLG